MFSFFSRRAASPSPLRADTRLHADGYEHDGVIHSRAVSDIESGSSLRNADLNATHLPGRTLAGESIVATMVPSPSGFWGRSEVPFERWRVFELGYLRLWAGRFAGEWRLAQERRSVGNDGTWNMFVDSKGPPAGVTLERFAVSDRDRTLLLAPILPNRPLVFRPQAALYLPENEVITVFVEIPLWVACCAMHPLRELSEIAIERLSDTWFGPTNREGELGYACRSRYAIDVAYLPVSPFRATCAITLANRTDAALKLERLRLRVESLALYLAEDGRVWTQDVVFERTRHNDLITMQVRAGAPLGAVTAESISQPRRRNNANLVLKALSHFFDG